MERQNEYVQICVACCKLNRENRKNLPFICPKTNMPCFAIDPKYLIPEMNEKMLDMVSNNKSRLPIDSEYIDKHFVDTRCEVFEDLAQKGNKTIYTMKAY